MSMDRDDPAWNGDGTERLMRNVIEQQHQSRAAMMDAARAEAVLAFVRFIADARFSLAPDMQDAEDYIKAQGWALPAAERTKP